MAHRSSGAGLLGKDGWCLTWLDGKEDYYSAAKVLTRFGQVYGCSPCHCVSCSFNATATESIDPNERMVALRGAKRNMCKGAELSRRCISLGEYKKACFQRSFPQYLARGRQKIVLDRIDDFCHP